MGFPSVHTDQAQTPEALVYGCTRTASQLEVAAYLAARDMLAVGGT